eukprot:7190997-Prymnesium_polylepis.1
MGTRVVPAMVSCRLACLAGSGSPASAMTAGAAATTCVVAAVEGRGRARAQQGGAERLVPKGS